MDAAQVTDHDDVTSRFPDFNLTSQDHSLCSAVQGYKSQRRCEGANSRAVRFDGACLAGSLETVNRDVPARSNSPLEQS